MSYSFSPGHGLKIPYPNTSTTLTTGRLPTSHYSSSEDTATFTTSSGSSTGQMVSVQDTTYVETENSTLAFTVTGVQSSRTFSLLSTSASSSLSTSASSSLSTSTSSSLSTSSSSSKIPTPSMSSSTLGSTSVSRTVDRTTIGMAVGTVIGGLCIVGGLLWYWCRRKRVRIRVLFENNMDEPAPGPRTAATVPPTATDTMTTAKEPEYMDSEPQNPFVDENAVDLVESVPHSADAVPGFQERIRRPPSSSRALPGDAPPPSATSPSISPPPSFVTQPPSESNRTSFNQHADSGLRFCPDFESQVSVPRCRVVDLPPAYTPN